MFRRIHIRRTDKIGTEAAYHSLDEYMYHAEEYFAILDAAAGNGLKRQRRVFIASDDPSVILEAKSKYGFYHQAHFENSNILLPQISPTSLENFRKYKNCSVCFRSSSLQTCWVNWHNSGCCATLRMRFYSLHIFFSGTNFG